MAWEPLFSKIAEQAACSTGILCFAWKNVSFFGSLGLEFLICLLNNLKYKYLVMQCIYIIHIFVLCKEERRYNT